MENCKKTRSNNSALEGLSLQKHDSLSNNSPLEGESNGLMPFGGGLKKLATNSSLNFAKNISNPSPHRQQVGSATLPFKYSMGESYNIELKNKNVIRFYSKQTLEFAKNLRNSQTDAEILLWYYLKNKQLGGYKFRRQQPIDKYIIDFVCFEKN